MESKPSRSIPSIIGDLCLAVWDKGFVGPKMEQGAILYEGLLDGTAISLAWNGKQFLEADHPAFAAVNFGLAIGFFAGGRLVRLGFTDYVYDSSKDKS